MEGKDGNEEVKIYVRKEWKAGMMKRGMEGRDDEERNGRQG